MIQIPKGTKDVLPSESYKWRKVRQTIDSIAKRYNYKEIMTPTFEYTELFVRCVGTGSDIVNKEMYTFKDKGDRSITLKPEGTASVARSFIENGLFNETLPLKMFYITPCFRYERPQEGRLREHHQFGIELYGPNTVLSEVEVLMVASEFYKSFGIEPVVHINNLGCTECRQKYINTLKDYASKHIDDMCEDCHNRINTNPLRMLDCKSRECQAILKDAPLIQDMLCDKCSEHFAHLLKLLDIQNIKYVVDPKLVRGIDYYTNVVFEFVDEDKTLGQNALGGGGRYNNLVEELGGKNTPVIGLGIGIERLLLYLEKKGIRLEDENKVDVYIASATYNDEYILKLAKHLRENGISTEIDLMLRSLKAQFKYADKLNVKYVLTIGDDEISSNEIAVKNMQTGEQTKVNANKLVKFLKENN